MRFQKNHLKMASQLLSSALGHSKKFGIQGLKAVGLIALLFIPTNLLFGVISLFYYDTSNQTVYWASVLITWVIGFGMVIWAALRVYRYLIFKGLNTVYDSSESLVYGFCEQAVAQAARLSGDYFKMDADKLQKAFEIDAMLSQSYTEKVPEAARKVIQLVLERVPFGGFVLGVKDVIVRGDQAGAAQLLHGKIDDYVHDNLFGDVNMRWMFWFWPLNVVIQVIVMIANKNYLFLLMG